MKLVKLEIQLKKLLGGLSYVGYISLSYPKGYDKHFRKWAAPFHIQVSANVGTTPEQLIKF